MSKRKNLSFNELIKEKLNLNDDEANVYLSLLIYGPLSSYALSDVTGVGVSQLNVILEKLVELSFIYKLDKPDRYVAYPPYKVISAKTYTITTEIANRKDSFQKISHSIITQIKNSLSKSTEKIEKGLLQNKSKFVEKFQAHEESVKNTLKQLEESISKVTNNGVAISKNIKDINKKFKSLAESLSKSITTTLDKYVLENEKIISRYADIFKTALENELEQESAKIASIIETIREASELSLEQVEEILGKYKENKTSAVDSILNSLTQLERELTRGISSFGEYTGNLLSTLSKEYYSTFVTKADEFYEYFSELFNNTKEDTLSRLNEIIEETINNAETLTEIAKKDFHKLGEKIDSVLNEKQSELSDKVTSFDSSISTTFDDTSNKLSNYLKNYLQSFSQYTEQTKESIDLVLGDILSETKNTIPTTTETLTRILDDFKKTILTSSEEIKEVVENTIKTHLGDLNQIQNNFTKDLRNVIDNLVSNVNDKIKSLNENFERKTSTLRNEIMSKLAELKEYSKKQLMAYKEQLMKTNETLYTNLFSKFDTNVAQEIERVDRVIKKIDEFFENNIKGFEEIFNEGQKEIIRLMDLQMKELQKNQKLWTDGISNTFSQILTQFSNFINELQNNMITFMDSQVTSFSGTLNSTINLLANSLNNYLKKNLEESEQLKAELVNELTEYFNTLSDLKKDIENTYNEFKVTQNEHINTLFASLEKSTLDHIANSHATIIGMLEQSSSELIKSLSEESRLFRASVNELIKATNTKTKRMVQVFSKFLGDTQSSLENIIVESINKIATPTQESIERINSLIQTLVSSIESMISAEKMDLRQKFDEILSTQRSEITALINNTTEDLQKTKSKISNELREFKDTTAITIETVGEEIKAIYENIISRVSEISENTKRLHNNELTNINTTFEEMIQSINEKVSERKEFAQKELNTLMSRLQEQSSKKLDSVIEEAKATISDTIASGKGSIESLSSDFDSTISEISTFVNTSIKKEFARFSTSYKEVLDIFSKIKETTITNLQNTSNELKVESTKLLKNIKDNIATQVQQHISDAYETLSKTEKTISEDFLTAINTLKASSSFLNNMILGALDDSINSITDLVNESIMLVKTETNKTTTNTEKQLNKFSKEVVTLIELLRNEVNSLSDINEFLADLIKFSVEKKPKHTWHVYEMKSTLAQAKDIISHSEEIVSIILPNIDSGLIDTIKNIPEDVIAEIVVSNDIPENIIAELLRKNNCRIWVTNKPVNAFCVVKDDSEAILVPSFDETKGIVGMVTTSQEMISLIKKTVFPYFMRRSKKVKSK